MALTTDEQAMRGALQELGGAQPDAPIDRLDGVRRRYRRRRTAQSVGAALGVAALVAGGLSVSTALRTTRHHPSIAATPAQPWQLTWPERNDGTVDKQRVLFWVGQQGFEGLHNVRWLYAATAPDTITKWAILEANYGASPSPVVNALITAVSHDGGDKWTAQTHGAPLVSTEVVGVADQQGHAVLALAAPGVDSVDLIKMRRADGIDEESFPPLVNGAATITSATALKPGSTLVRKPGAPSTSLVLFDDDQQAVGEPMWWNTSPVRPRGDVRLGSSFGGGGGGFSNIVSPQAGTVVLQVRCVGPVPMRLIVTTKTTTQDLDVDRCDGLFHTYLGPQVVSGDHIGVDNKGSHDRYGDLGDNEAVIDVSLRP